MQQTVLITSGAYIAPELIAEFGKLPPSFLPVGNRRLFALQHVQLRDCADRIFISLPEGFDIPVMDRALLDSLGIQIIFVPEGMSLAKSVRYCMDAIPSLSGHFSILHGDTVIFDFAYDIPDSVSVGDATSYYHWAIAQREGDQIVRITDSLPEEHVDGVILSGFFSFSDSSLFRRCLNDKADEIVSFVKALDSYTRERSLRAINSGMWLDFGHIHTYFSSRCQITTQRSFNNITFSHRYITKSSSRRDRIDAEVHWYENLPAKMRLFVPHYLGRTEHAAMPAYELEYLYLSSLSDLFVFGALSNFSWATIFGSCAEFLLSCRDYPADAASAASVMELYLEKTLSRLQSFATESGIDLKAGWRLNGTPLPSLEEIASIAASRISVPGPKHLTLVHGDFCFSNILYDFRTSSVRVIDPRGQDARGIPSVFGDQRYDIAKLYHSVYGLYDLILAGYYDLKSNAQYDLTFSLLATPNLKDVQDAFDQMLEDHFAAEKTAVQAINVLLFLSMLPLHRDDEGRQRALLANALRLFSEIER